MIPLEDKKIIADFSNLQLHNEKSKYYKITEHNGSYYVTGFSEKGKEFFNNLQIIVIPKTIDNKKIVGLGKYCFGKMGKVKTIYLSPYIDILAKKSLSFENRSKNAIMKDIVEYDNEKQHFSPSIICQEAFSHSKFGAIPEHIFDKITKLPTYCFANSIVTDILIFPKCLKAIGFGAFWCATINNIFFSSNQPLEINDYSFYNSKISKIIIKT